jgi:hypothetical protein
MNNAIRRLAQVTPFVVTLLGCQSSLPLPLLPPPGPVTTADEAIRIAINACKPSAYDARDSGKWQARLDNDQWIASWTRAGLRRAPLGIVIRLEIKIHAQDGRPENCSQYTDVPPSLLERHPNATPLYRTAMPMSVER